jgi:hypothetical protein
MQWYVRICDSLVAMQVLEGERNVMSDVDSLHPGFVGFFAASIHHFSQAFRLLLFPSDYGFGKNIIQLVQDNEVFPRIWRAQICGPHFDNAVMLKM